MFECLCALRRDRYRKSLEALGPLAPGMGWGEVNTKINSASPGILSGSPGVQAGEERKVAPTGQESFLVKRKSN